MTDHQHLPLSLNASDEAYRLFALAAQLETLAMRLDADYPLAVWRELEKLITRLDATSKQLFDNAIIRLEAEQEAAAS